MVFICYCGIVNCIECRKAHQRPATDIERVIIIERCGCPKCNRNCQEVQAGSNEQDIIACQSTTEPLRDSKLVWSVIVSFLESLRKATEALEKLLEAAEEKVDPEEETLPSTASLIENNTNEHARLTELMEKESNIEDKYNKVWRKLLRKML